MDTQLVELLQFCVKQDASDLHLAPGLPPMMRINGDLVPAPNLPIIDANNTKKLIYSSMESAQQQEFEKTLELDFGLLVLIWRFSGECVSSGYGVQQYFVIPENSNTRRT